MAGLVPQDVPMFVKSSVTSSERRITPSWSISQFKARLEPITGIPPSCQILSLKTPGRDTVVIQAAEEDTTQLGFWDLQPYAEIHVSDSRPEGIANADFTDTSNVQKYTMSEESYEALPSTVLAWKKANKLGRFDPEAPEIERTKIEKMWQHVHANQIKTGLRCQLGKESSRRGKVAFIGEVDEISGLQGPWIGVELDEPTGKNDGTMNGKRYFECGKNKGIFVRPERVVVGDYGVLEDDLDTDLEEI